MIKSISFLFFFILTLSMNLSAGDLDDGITADELNKDDLDLDVNIQYIKRRAKAAAESAKSGKKQPAGGKVIVNTACGGTGNQTFGAGTNLKGATIVNLSNNKGSTTVCAQ